MREPRWIPALLLCLFLPAAGMAKDAQASLPPSRQAVRQTVVRSIGYLQSQSGKWLGQGRCAACHHAAMPLWALSVAAGRGYAVDRKFLAHTAEGALGSQKNMMASGILANPAAPPDPRPLARGVNTGAVFMAVAARSLPELNDGEKECLRLIASQIISKQQKDGSWEFFLSRPPINENQATDAAWILMALQDQVRAEPTETARASLEKGVAWLASAEPGNLLQVRVLKLLVRVRGGASGQALEPAINEILALQRSDGGWDQIGQGASDAFATGQTLYVLGLAGYGCDRPAIARAVSFLVSTQKPDGSWPMTSRATPDGRPGSAKLLTPITCAATAWASMGLATLIPQAGPGEVSAVVSHQ